MEFMLVLSEDPDLIATDQQRAEAVQHVDEYAMGLVSDGTLKGGAPLRPGRPPGYGSPSTSSPAAS